MKRLGMQAFRAEGIAHDRCITVKFLETKAVKLRAVFFIIKVSPDTLTTLACFTSSSSHLGSVCFV